MKKLVTLIGLALLCLSLAACSSSDQETAGNSSADQRKIQQKIADAFDLKVKDIAYESTSTLANGDEKLIMKAGSTVFGVVEKDGKIYTMYPGNRVRNYLEQNKKQLGINSIAYPVQQYHSDITAGYQGLRLIILLKDDSPKNQTKVLTALQEEFGQDLTGSIAFSQSYPEDFLSPAIAIWEEAH